ncbi:RMD1 family protein [Petroclostridium sp. X23]|uniref:RMD1 family protein n=1 Tax=Petroclostridium sp. X23 TaxID=3045146 RepID=UPI0024AE6749|nr:RMD1 family protein [Petroclostridium sp. X23]WHH57310.1 RMD1 family protein [Petroclostridium sp. X23]
MAVLNFDSYKIAPGFPLNKIALFFQTHSPLSWKEYIHLTGHHISAVLKYKMGNKQVFIFCFGAIVFVDFTQQEIYAFLQHLESIIDGIDYSFIAKYHEGHSIHVSSDGKCTLWKDQTKYFIYHEYIVHVIAGILAKSVAISKIEESVNRLLNEGEDVLSNLQKGRLNFSKKNNTITTARILRFEYESISSIGLFDQSTNLVQSIQSKEIYDFLENYYELYDRYKIIQSKIFDLRRIMKSYAMLSYKYHEAKRYLLEIFLLALFPLFHLAHYLMDTYAELDIFHFLY